MPNTALNALPYPALGAGADGPAAFQALAEAVAPKLHRAEPLTAAQIAAISSPRIGQLVSNTDTGRVLFWNGTAWRPVGGNAFGATTIGAVAIAAGSYVTMSAFIGLGFEEVSFTLFTGGGYGAQITAVSDAIRAQGIGFTNQATPMNVFAPTSATDTLPVTFLNSSNGAVLVNLRNARLDADGFLRFEAGGPNGLTTSANLRLNWRAR